MGNIFSDATFGAPASSVGNQIFVAATRDIKAICLVGTSAFLARIVKLNHSDCLASESTASLGWLGRGDAEWCHSWQCSNLWGWLGGYFGAIDDQCSASVDVQISNRSHVTTSSSLVVGKLFDRLVGDFIESVHKELACDVAVSQQLFSRGEEDRAVALRLCKLRSCIGFDDEALDVQGEGWVVHVISFLS